MRAGLTRKALETYCLLICLCLKDDSFWLAGLIMASEGLTYVPLLLRYCVSEMYYLR